MLIAIKYLSSMQLVQLYVIYQIVLISLDKELLLDLEVSYGCSMEYRVEFYITNHYFSVCYITPHFCSISNMRSARHINPPFETTQKTFGRCNVLETSADPKISGGYELYIGTRYQCRQIFGPRNRIIQDR